MRTDDLDYELPEQQIATGPVEPRDSARLMVLHREADRIEHRRVSDLTDLLRPTDLVVLNRTEVLPASFQGTREQTGGRVSGIFLSSPGPGTWLVLLEARGTLEATEAIFLGEHGRLVLTESLGAGQWKARCQSSLATDELLECVGQTPLPPYIRRSRRLRRQAEITADDAANYNTVYAVDRGSVAAPTAGLHFTRRLLDEMAGRGVMRADITLHIGLGTFAPIRAATLAEHPIHSERMLVPAATRAAIGRTRAHGGRIVPIGTTTVRALESLPDRSEPPHEDFSTATSLFIRPDSGFEFRHTDALMTNFHLPRSTLLALVAALPGVGLDRLKKWYRVAIDEGYRFYSYGDAMLIL